MEGTVPVGKVDVREVESIDRSIRCQHSAPWPKVIVISARNIVASAARAGARPSVPESMASITRTPQRTPRCGRIPQRRYQLPEGPRQLGDFHTLAGFLGGRFANVGLNPRWLRAYNADPAEYGMVRERIR
jgi:hypothetical protein